MIRRGARRRKLPFSLTLAQFQQFCAETGYIELRGTQRDSLTIDRINHEEGYHIWNIKVATHIDNSMAGHTIPGMDVPQNFPKPSTRAEWDAGQMQFAMPVQAQPVLGENEPF